MSSNPALAGDLWARYQFLRDNGHLDYVDKANKCEDFFAGLQWDKATKAVLQSQRRPAITINKIIATMSNVMGEQIFNRSEINFRPARKGATGEIADDLTRVYRHISEDNQLDWVRSDVFADGIITSRGFYDCRLDFSKDVGGEVRITALNPKNVLVDADADEYDPSEWGDVIVSKWMSTDQIAFLYNEDDAEALRGTQDGFWPYTYDSIDRDRDRFGHSRTSYFSQQEFSSQGLVRSCRVLDRQWKKLDQSMFFVNTQTGDLWEVPHEWDRDKISFELSQRPNMSFIKQLSPRIRWTVVADKFVLHDDWSPYKHFTVIPFFPHFRRGRTIGLVENLLGPQELLNKVRSQELHIVNTTANSGWLMRQNALKNMTPAELEEKGASTGLVLEVDEVDHITKIQPNQVPSGLDRISYKSEEDIKNISGVSDYQTGNPREDVSAKAVKYNQVAGSANLAKVLDNLRRSDFFLARAALTIVQSYYTEPRLMTITTDKVTGAGEQLAINQVSPEGEILNDLTLGEYGVVVTSEPQRDTLEDTQFEQAMMLKTEAGIQLPDSVFIKNSKLRDKAAIIQEIEAASNSPEAEEAREMQRRSAAADIMNKESEAQQKQADSKLKDAQALKALQEAGHEDVGVNAELQVEMAKIEKEHALKMQQMQMEFALKKEQADREFMLDQRKLQQELAIKQQMANTEMAARRAESAVQMRVANAQASVHTAKAAQMSDGGQEAMSAKPKRKLSLAKGDNGTLTISEMS